MYREDLKHFEEKERTTVLYAKYIKEYCLACVKHGSNCDSKQMGECAMAKAIDNKYLKGVEEDC